MDKEMMNELNNVSFYDGDLKNTVSANIRTVSYTHLTLPTICSV